MKTNSIYYFLIAISLCFFSCGMSEKEYFDRAVTENTVESYSVFLATFPDGEYAEEAYFNICKIMNFRLIYDIDYIQKFPQGKHIIEVEREYNRIWQQIKIEYDNANKNNNSQGTLFMSDLLDWMKDNRTYTINVSVDPKFKMKDYTDYSTSFIKSIEAFMKSKGANETDYMPYKTYGRTDIDYTYEHIYNRVYKFFPPYTIKIISLQESEHKDESPTAIISCDIHPVENSAGLPVVWDIYNEKGSLSCFVMSLCIDYKFDIKIPNTSKTYSCSGHILPKNEFAATNQRITTSQELLLSCVDGMLDDIFEKIGVLDAK